MILVTGATGNIGGAVVRALSGSGQSVRVLTRAPAKATFPAYVDVVGGDLGEPSTLTAAFEGVEKLFLVDTTFGTSNTANALAAARAAGVRHIVSLSSIGVALGLPSALGAVHADREEVIRASGIPATFLQPSHFMTNSLAWIPALRARTPVKHPIADGRFPLLAPEDIAAVAALALTEPGHEGAAYVLTGEEPMAVSEQVAVLAKILDREIPIEEVSLDAAEAALIARGLAPEHAAAVRDLNEHMRAGRTNVVTATVRELLGRGPVTFEAWCRENAAAFEG